MNGYYEGSVRRFQSNPHSIEHVDTLARRARQGSSKARSEVTLECEVCGAGWKASGQVMDDLSWPFEGLNGFFFCDELEDCPECGEADAWDTVE